MTELPTLAHAHVLELGRQVESPSTSWLSTDLEVTLTAWGLLTWNGGGAKVAKPNASHDEFELVRTPSCVVTVPGHAFLRAYELGCQRLQADTMTAGPKKPSQPRNRR